MAALVLAVSSCADESEGAGSATAESGPSVTTTAAPEATPFARPTPYSIATFDYPVYSIAETFEFASMRLTVNSFEVTDEIGTTDGSPIVADPGEDFVLFRTHYVNLGSGAVDLSCSGLPDMWLLAEDVGGREMVPEFETYRIPGNPECNHMLMSGQESDWNFAYRMIEGAKPLVLIAEETQQFEDRVGVALQLYSTPIPAISGTAVVDQVLSAIPGTWEPDPVDLSYQWYSGEVAIAGAVAATYIAQPADVGAALRVTVVGTKTGYEPVAQTSAFTGLVAEAEFTATPSPTISGKPQAGQTLTALPGEWAPDPVNFAYQWYRGTTRIPGATAADYVVQDADVRYPLKVEVTGSRDGYLPVRVASDQTRNVEPGTDSA